MKTPHLYVTFFSDNLNKLTFGRCRCCCYDHWIWRVWRSFLPFSFCLWRLVETEWLTWFESCDPDFWGPIVSDNLLSTLHFWIVKFRSLTHNKSRVLIKGKYTSQVQTNLDLRKMLVTPKIFLKSRFLKFVLYKMF